MSDSEKPPIDEKNSLPRDAGENDASKDMARAQSRGNTALNSYYKEKLQRLDELKEMIKKEELRLEKLQEELTKQGRQQERQKNKPASPTPNKTSSTETKSTDSPTNTPLPGLPSLDFAISSDGHKRPTSESPSNPTSPKGSKEPIEPKGTTSPKESTSPESSAKPRRKTVLRSAKERAIAGGLAITSLGSAILGGALLARNQANNKTKQPSVEETSLDASANSSGDSIKLSDGSEATWASDLEEPIFTDDYQAQPPFLGNQPGPVIQEAKPSHFSGMSEREIFEMMSKSPEFRQGLIDGYKKEALWHSVNLPGRETLHFASARNLAPMFNNDEVDMVQYVAANEPEGFADYLGCLPPAIQLKAIKGLNIEQISQMIENLDDASYKGLQTWFNNVMDMAYTRRTVLNGLYQNAYMMLKDGNGPLTHENMQLVSCISNEIGTEVTEFYWLNDKNEEIGSMLVKMTPIRNPRGDIVGFDGCMQAVKPAGGHLYDGMPSINQPPSYNPTSENPTPEQPTPGGPTPIPVIVSKPDKPKDAENLKRIDEEAHKDIATDIGTGKVVVHQETVTNDNLTDQATSTDYEGTDPAIIQNNEASTVTEQFSPEKPANEYSNNQGGAHDNEYSPVQSNESAQTQAIISEIPIEQAPTDGVDLESILAEFGNVSEADRIINEVKSNPAEYAPMEGISIEDILAEYGIQ